MRSPGDEIEALREQLESGDRGGSDADREALLAFSTRLRLLKTEYTDHRHIKLLRHCTRMSEHAEADLADALTDREPAEVVVSWINRTYDNEETNRDYRSALRVFGKRVVETRGFDDLPTDDHGIPDALSWVPTGTSRSYDPSPDPAAMLEWEPEVKPMIDHSPNPRDKALVGLAFDAGPRSGELFDLRVGDVTDSRHGLSVRVDGKTGARSVTLIPSVPYVKRWRFEDHPTTSDPDAPLWSLLDDGTERISHRRFLDIFDAAAKRIHLTKPTTPTAFRKSNASWLARQGASSHLIEDRQGRSRGSPIVARYVARFGDAEGDRYAALHGRDVDRPDASDMDPPTCPRCGEQTPAGEPACVWCGQAMEPGAAEAADLIRSRVRESMARSDDPAERARYLQALEAMDTDPEIAADAIMKVMDTVDRYHDDPSR